MKKRKKGISNDWLNTYSDMVTLLLCFFVLLYSMSSVDSAKWEKIVKSFNPPEGEVSQIVESSSGSLGNYDVEGGFDDEFDELYYKLSKYVETQGIDADVEVSRGDGFTFITFTNNIFFDGDRYELKSEGKEVLDQLCYALEDISDSISEIQVLGHTSQASPTVPNEVESDRFLSSNRAAEVLVYIQNKNIIEPKKLVSSGFGQFRPCSSFETRESRAKNRRVEIIITKNDSVVRTLDNYYNEVYGIDTSQTQN
ncbi:OmpA/MotB family protein [Anaerotignum sp. MB30-C6]|uniref:OmpA/MotB family protein n=1 Tax=Anaerotignum sp. MB30-C6 TaxID=3070814 RepID=UPI0027DC937D|nr:flagellar motor protein MotB [Anaerotignum sp. MB30-C6]WMI80978.1 flagellar motor protein MotB [Anaerotignum sp. MB30-C6]